VKHLLKAAVLGVLLALAVFAVPFVFPLLMLLLVASLLRRIVFGHPHGRWQRRATWAAHARWAAQAGQPVPIDGRVWQRNVQGTDAAHAVQVR
jgi:hypothetical protein